jgi:actin-related protein 5
LSESVHLMHLVTSELLFELYQVPRLAYCLDSIMSLYFNSHAADPSIFAGDACVISFNTASTSIIPVLAGSGIMSRAKRLLLAKLAQSALTISRVPWGVTQCSEYLAKVIQLKYPNFPGKITSQNANVSNLLYIY